MAIFSENLLLSQSYNLVVVTTILGFDIAETFQDEVLYIWKEQWSITTVLYLITRYVPFIIHIIEAAYKARNFDSLYATGFIYCIPWVVVLGCTEYLFLKRALALNGNPRWLRYLLTGLYVADIISGSVLYSLLLGPSVGPSLRNLALQGTTNSPDQSLFHVEESLGFSMGFGIPEIIFQSVLVLVIIGTIIRHWKTWTSLGKCSLTTIIVRDGLWGFFFNLFGLLVIIIQPIWLAGPNGQADLQWSYLTFSVTSSRLLLNIRSGAGTPGISTDARPTLLSFANRSQTISETDNSGVVDGDV